MGLQVWGFTLTGLGFRVWGSRGFRSFSSRLSGVSAFQGWLGVVADFRVESLKFWSTRGLRAVGLPVFDVCGKLRDFLVCWGFQGFGVQGPGPLGIWGCEFGPRAQGFKAPDA